MTLLSGSLLAGLASSSDWRNVIRSSRERIYLLRISPAKMNAEDVANSFCCPFSCRTVDLSHDVPDFWQLEQIGYSLSHCHPLATTLCKLSVHLLSASSTCTACKPSYLASGDCNLWTVMEMAHILISRGYSW